MEQQLIRDITFALIKPDAVRAGNTGKIIDLIEKNDKDVVVKDADVRGLFLCRRVSHL